MPVELKDVTDGYWYAKDKLDINQTIVIVQVWNDFAFAIGKPVSKHKNCYTFLGRVPDLKEITNG